MDWIGTGSYTVTAGDLLNEPTKPKSNGTGTGTGKQRRDESEMGIVRRGVLGLYLPSLHFKLRNLKFCGISAGHLHTALAPSQPIRTAHVRAEEFQNGAVRSAVATSATESYGRRQWKRPRRFAQDTQALPSSQLK